MLEGVLKVDKRLNLLSLQQVSILGMLEGVLKDRTKPINNMLLCVSILGMLEGVLKAGDGNLPSFPLTCFNPWYVGGGVKSMMLLSVCLVTLVSILGMLEGVLKVG